MAAKIPANNKVPSALHTLNFSLRWHVNFARSEQVWKELLSEDVVVFIPLSKNVLAEQMLCSFQGEEEGIQRHEDEWNSGQTVQPSHRNSELWTGPSISSRDENKDSAEN